MSVTMRFGVRPCFFSKPDQQSGGLGIAAGLNDLVENGNRFGQRHAEPMFAGLVANFHRGLGYPLKDAIFMFC
ncbi:hypothetical protein ACVIKO_000280 [Rhizobium ruizarguesonis]